MLVWLHGVSRVMQCSSWVHQPPWCTDIWSASAFGDKSVCSRVAEEFPCSRFISILPCEKEKKKSYQTAVFPVFLTWRILVSVKILRQGFSSPSVFNVTFNQHLHLKQWAAHVWLTKWETYFFIAGPDGSSGSAPEAAPTFKSSMCVWPNIERIPLYLHTPWQQETHFAANKEEGENGLSCRMDSQHLPTWKLFFCGNFFCTPRSHCDTKMKCIVGNAEMTLTA